MENAFFRFLPDPAPSAANWIPRSSASNWILRRFGMQRHGKLDSDAIALVQLATWNPDAAPKAEILLPSYAAFDFGRGVTVTVNRQSVEIEISDANFAPRPRDGGRLSTN